MKSKINKTKVNKPKIKKVSTASVNSKGNDFVSIGYSNDDFKKNSNPKKKRLIGLNYFIGLGRIKKELIVNVSELLKRNGVKDSNNLYLAKGLKNKIAKYLLETDKLYFRILESKTRVFINSANNKEVSGVIEYKVIPNTK